MTSAAEYPVRAYREGLTERVVAVPRAAGAGHSGRASPNEVGVTIAAAYVELFDAWYRRFWWVDDERTMARVIAHHPAEGVQESWEHEKRLDVTEGDDKSLVALVVGSGQAASSVYCRGDRGRRDPLRLRLRRAVRPPLPA